MIASAQREVHQSLTAVGPPIGEPAPKSRVFFIEPVEWRRGRIAPVESNAPLNHCRVDAVVSPANVPV